MDVREILRQIRAGESDRRIGQNMQVHRATVKKYREWAEAQGLLEGELPPLEEIAAQRAETLPEPPVPRQVSSVEPYRAVVEELRGKGVGMSAIHARLREQGFGGSYGAVQRFVHRLEPASPEVVVRVERAPGEEAQVDFGAAGYMLDADGRLRKAWVFVMTLSYSRHQYVAFVFDQRAETWIDLHRHAFEFFGGVPQRVVIDNLKAGITRASWDGTDPQLQRSYRECAEHYGFIVAPCRPYTPEHKGKVERGVGYVKHNFLAGRDPQPLAQANREVLTWCLGTAGERIHGTTKQPPLERFAQAEHAALHPLPEQPYEWATWKTVKLHRDGHVVFEGAYYSAPFRLVGQRLLVRGTCREVRLYTEDYQLVATHSRAAQPGERITLTDHLPPHKVEGLLWNAERALARAEEIGPATAEVTREILGDPVLDPLPKARRLLALAHKVGAARLEAACQRALDYADPAYQTVKRILKHGLEDQPQGEMAYRPGEAATFARSTAELVGAWSTEVVSW